jgi:hypothetical protein
VERVKRSLPVLLRSGLATRLLLILFAVLAVSVVFVGLNDTPGFILAYLATTVIFVILVRRWRSIKNYVILFLATFCIGVFLSGLYMEVISRLAVWLWGIGALDSLPLRIIEWIISYVIIFAGPVGLAFGFFGTLALSVWRLVRPRSRLGVADRT